jgi:hypothetical protein
MLSHLPIFVVGSTLRFRPSLTETANSQKAPGIAHNLQDARDIGLSDNRAVQRQLA